MSRRMLDLSGHRSRPVDSLDVAVFDRMYTVSSRHAAYVRSLGVPAARIHVVAADRGGVQDPFGGDDAVYEETARTLEHEVSLIVASLSDQH